MQAVSNPYQTPGSSVEDQGEQYSEVKILSTAGRLGRVRYIGYTIGLSMLPVSYTHLTLPTNREV